MRLPSEREMIYRVIGWSVVGLLVGMVVVFFIPRTPHEFVSTVVLDVPEPAGRTVELAPVHAGILVSKSDLAAHWGCSFDEALRRVIDGTRLMATKEGVEIRVTCRNNDDCRDIAHDMAGLFRSMDREEALAARPPIVPLSPEVERKRSEDLKFLTFVLKCQADKLNVGDFKGVEARAAAGSEPDQKLWASEEFQRHWKAYQDLPVIPRQSIEEAGPPPRVLVQPEIGTVVANHDQLIVESGEYGGLLGGLCFGLWSGSRAARRMVNADRKALEDPDANRKSATEWEEAHKTSTERLDRRVDDEW